jgi:hypothetical protein
LGYIQAYPGSHIYKVACEKGIICDPIQFMRDKCPPVNITKMTDDEYYALAVVMDILKAKHKLSDAIVETLDDGSVNVYGVCPHCGNRTGYPRYQTLFNYFPQSCPVCGKPVIVNPIEYCDITALNKNLSVLRAGKKLAVWAVHANNFYWLLESMPGLQSEDVFFINQNEVVIPQNQQTVRSLGGKHIYTPGVLDERGIDTVLVPNNPGVYREIVNQCAKNFPHVKNVVHLTECIT